MCALITPWILFSVSPQMMDSSMTKQTDDIIEASPFVLAIIEGDTEIKKKNHERPLKIISDINWPIMGLAWIGSSLGNLFILDL